MHTQSFFSSSKEPNTKTIIKHFKITKRTSLKISDVLNYLTQEKKNKTQQQHDTNNTNTQKQIQMLCFSINQTHIRCSRKKIKQNKTKKTVLIFY
jgi:hypothetical protein